MADIVSDLGVNLLEEEIDEVIFQTNQFLTDATFTGSQGPFWWFLLAEFWDCLEPSVNQLLAAICSAVPKTDGTKTRFIDSKSCMSGCPVQITSASYTHKVTKLSRLDQESRRESTVFQPEKPTISRVRIPRKILQIGYSDTPGEKS